MKMKFFLLILLSTATLCCTQVICDCFPSIGVWYWHKDTLLDGNIKVTRCFTGDPYHEAYCNLQSDTISPFHLLNTLRANYDTRQYTIIGTVDTSFKYYCEATDTIGGLSRSTTSSDSILIKIDTCIKGDLGTDHLWTTKTRIRTNCTSTFEGYCASEFADEWDTYAYVVKNETYIMSFNTYSCMDSLGILVFEAEAPCKDQKSGYYISNDTVYGDFMGIPLRNTLDEVYSRFASNEEWTQHSSIQMVAYPNPFNPTVTIQTGLHKQLYRYHLGESSGALRIFDTNGRMVADLTSCLKNGSVTWDASRLPSGTYIARLAVGNRIYSKILVLMK